MKRSTLVLILLCSLLCLSGCKKEENTIELLPVSKEGFVYESAEAGDEFTVDEEGFLYTTRYLPGTKSGEVFTADTKKPDCQQITVYDLEGNCTGQTKVEMGSGTVQAMFASGELLYCAVGSGTLSGCPAVYTLNTNTWEVTEVALLEELREVRNMVLLDGYLYILGISATPEAKNYTLYPGIIGYNYLGEVVGRVDMNDTEAGLLLLNIDFPVGIFGTTADTLGIYHYTEDNGFGFLEYSPAEGTLTETGWSQDVLAAQRFTGCEDGCVFASNGELYFGTLDGAKTQISSKSLRTLKNVAYRKGFVFFINYNTGNMERIPAEIHNNREIKLLLHDDIMDKPYGCGYRMDDLVLDEEQFALKALAQDRDFDLYLLSSRATTSYNLKENGAFYPLNEVEGVQEYLDACFPYVKETATNEEGDIWMVPVGLAIRGMAYNKEYCEENRVDLAAMDYMELLDFTQKSEREQPEKTSISLMCVMEELFGRYLLNYESFDTEVFRSYAEKLKEIFEEQGSWGFDITLLNEIRENTAPEIFYDYQVYSNKLSELAGYLGGSETIGLMGVPGITESDRNLGTLTFLAVNPQSENLETTLEYISAFAKFMTSKKDSFLLEDYATYTDTPFRKDWYELYKNGVVYFEIDREVYWDTFISYLKGEIELEPMIAEMERCRKMYMEE